MLRIQVSDSSKIKNKPLRGLFCYFLLMEPPSRFDLETPSLPWKCSTTELRRHIKIPTSFLTGDFNELMVLEVGLEPTKV